MKKLTLQDRIKNNSSYFKGMEVINNTLIIKVQYPPKWGTFPSEDESIKVAKSEETPNEWFYYADYMVITIDEVFDLIESTIDMNKSAAAKIQLLNDKFEELKHIFATEPLEKLQTLTFSMKEMKTTKRKASSKKAITTDENISEPNQVNDTVIDIEESC